MTSINFISPVQRSAELLTFEEKEQLLDEVLDQLKGYIKPGKSAAAREQLSVMLDPYVLLQGLSQEPTGYRNTI